MVSSVMWFRRDLRLADNPALLAACAADEVVPLFVIDPALWGPAGRVRRVYLLRSLDLTLTPQGGITTAAKEDRVFRTLFQRTFERVPSAIRDAPSKASPNLKC